MPGRGVRALGLRRTACFLVVGISLSCAGNLRQKEATVSRSGEGAPSRGGYADRASGMDDGIRREAGATERETPESKVERKGTKRVVLYSGRLTLVTPSVEEALTAVEDTARRFGGHVQSSRGGRSGRAGQVVVRVPAERFDEALHALAALGRVTERRISARDVTREFADLQAALKLHERTRSRLYELLKRTVSTPERIKILREVRRLSEAIERMKAQEKDIQSRAAFAVITVRLMPLQPERLSGFAATPFAWISQLHPRFRFSAPAHFQIKRPAGFFDFSEDYRRRNREQLFLSPAGTQIRLGQLDNEPQAKADFWKKAIQVEMDRRGYVPLTDGLPSGAPGPLFLFRLEDGGVELVYALVIVPQERRLFLAEAVFPSMSVYQAEGPKALASLASFRPDEPHLLERFLLWIGL